MFIFHFVLQSMTVLCSGIHHFLKELLLVVVELLLLLLPLEEEQQLLLLELHLINLQEELHSILSPPLHSGQEYLHTIPIPSSALKKSQLTLWVCIS